MSESIYELIKVICDKQKKEYNKYIESQPPRLNLLDQWRAKYENSHSRVLAKLLNPKGEHKQGSEFLKLFLQEIDIHDENWELEKATVKTELGIENQRRIDIFIQIDDKTCIIIENKIDAGDQKNQLKDYFESKKLNKYKNKYLLYLTKYGKDPSEYSINAEYLDELKDENIFYAISYRDDIIKWLEECKTHISKDEEKYFIESALIQYIDTLKGITKTREGIQNMKNEMITSILEQFSDESDINKKLVQVEQLRDEFEVSARVLSSIKTIEELIELASEKGFQSKLFLGKSTDNHRCIDSIKDILSNESKCEVFYIKFPIENSLLSVEFIPCLWKSNIASVGILKQDCRDSIKLLGKKIKDRTDKDGIWSYVRRFENGKDAFKEVKKFVTQQLNYFNESHNDVE